MRLTGPTWRGLAEALFRKGELSRQEIDELLAEQPRLKLVEPDSKTG